MIGLKHLPHVYSLKYPNHRDHSKIPHISITCCLTMHQARISNETASASIMPEVLAPDLYNGDSSGDKTVHFNIMFIQLTIKPSPQLVCTFVPYLHLLVYLVH
jgi:hypothetical protein